MEVVVRLFGVSEIALERLVNLGYFSTRSEALRAGLMELIVKYKVITEIDKQTVLADLEKNEKDKN